MLVLIIAASTSWTTGLISSIPVQAHVMLDYVLAIFLIAAPFVLGFSDDGTAAAFFIVIGVVHLLLTIATRFVGDEPRPSRRDPGPERTTSATVDTGRVPRHPLEPHAASPSELRDRLAAERRGNPSCSYRDGGDRQVYRHAPRTTRG